MRLDRAALKRFETSVYFICLLLVAGGVLSSPSKGVAAVVMSVAIAVLTRKSMEFLVRRAELEERSPNEPWRWRHSWAVGLGEPKGAVEGHLMGAVGIGLAFSVMPLATLIERELARGKWGVLFLCLLPLLGLTMFTTYVRMRLQRRKFGQSELKLETLPAPLGGKLRAQLLVEAPLRGREGVRASLRCRREYVTGSGKNANHRVELKWEESWRIEPVSDGAQTVVAVEIEIPFDLPPTDSTNPRDRMEWELLLESAEQGFDYRASFAVPVFKTPASDASRTQLVLSRENVRRSEADFARPVHYTVEQTAHGEVYRMKARAGSAARGFFVLGAVFTGLGLAMPILIGDRGVLTGFFWVFFSAFALVGGFILLIGLSELVGRATLVLEGERVVIRRSILGINLTQVLDRAQIERLELISQTKSSEKLWYDVEFHIRARKPAVLASRIPDKREAEALLVELERRLAA